jgi:hypothetical protein
MSRIRTDASWWSGCWIVAKGHYAPASNGTRSGFYVLPGRYVISATKCNSSRLGFTLRGWCASYRTSGAPSFCARKAHKRVWADGLLRGAGVNLFVGTCRS